MDKVSVSAHCGRLSTSFLGHIFIFIESNRSPASETDQEKRATTDQPWLTRFGSIRSDLVWTRPISGQLRRFYSNTPSYLFPFPSSFLLPLLCLHFFLHFLTFLSPTTCPTFDCCRSIDFEVMPLQRKLTSAFIPFPPLFFSFPFLSFLLFLAHKSSETFLLYTLPQAGSVSDKLGTKWRELASNRSNEFSGKLWERMNNLAWTLQDLESHFIDSSWPFFTSLYLSLFLLCQLIFAWTLERAAQRVGQLSYFWPYSERKLQPQQALVLAQITCFWLTCEPESVMQPSPWRHTRSWAWSWSWSWLATFPPWLLPAD